MLLSGKKWFWAFGLFLLWNCGGPPKPQQGFFATGKLRYSIERDKDGRKDGVERWYHENGRLKYEAHYTDGFRNGKYSAYYPDGKPWYEGYEIMGRPESTLTYWFPEGQAKSIAFYRQGMQLSRQDFDENGELLNKPPSKPLFDEIAESLRQDSVRAAAARNQAIELWSRRVRTTVEGHWVVPKSLAKKGSMRAVASLRVSRDGRIEEVTWVKKSLVGPFNTLAAGVFNKLKRLPPFPPEIRDPYLDIQYEFVSGSEGSVQSRLQSAMDRPPPEENSDSLEVGPPVEDEEP